MEVLLGSLFGSFARGFYLEFERADCERTEFERADCERTDFERADFELADFERADCESKVNRRDFGDGSDRGDILG